MRNNHRPSNPDPVIGSPSRPVSVRIRDVRSVWGPPVDVPLGELVTVLVGPNRSGTSNIAWAVAAALDPDRRFRPARDRPFRHAWPSDGPQVRVTDASGQHTTVRWDADSGDREQHGPLVTGHAVLSRIHETPRDSLRRAPIDLSDATEREAVAASILSVARALLPEVERVDIDDDAALRVHDDLGSTLPVPETRAMTALGLARHLADRGTPPALVVIESPDAFLHPAGQEMLARRLIDLAKVTGSPVIITTSSPFAIPRVPETTVVAIARDASGRTAVIGSAFGDETQARLLGGLLRDTGLAAVFDRVGQIAPDTRAVLIVEGGTDEAYLRLVAEALGRSDELDGVVIRPSGGAMGAALLAIVLRAELDTPVLVLLDHDNAGRRARDTLVSRFGFDRQTQVLTYADVIDGTPPGVEAETLFDPALVRRFVRERGPSASHGERDLHGLPHVDLTSSGKAAFVGWLSEHVRPEHLARWGDLLDRLVDRLPDGAGGPAKG